MAAEQTHKIYFKSDFQVLLESEAGWGVPFRLSFFTNAPSRPFVASYNGGDPDDPDNWTNCHLHDDGRLCVGFDDHGLGLGKLMVEARFYLDNECYESGVCDEIVHPFPVTATDEDTGEEYYISLSLEGASTLTTIGTLPAFYQRGPQGPRSEYAESDHARAELDHSTAISDHTQAASDHTTASSDHSRTENALGRVSAALTTAQSDHARANEDHSTSSDWHTLAAQDHGTATNDHTTATADHSIATNDHSTAASDHTQAGTDHTQAASDHTQASNDHATASADHTQASNDHATASADHTQASNDHATAASDHTNALEDRDNAITSTEVHYAEGTSATEAPTTGWQSDLPTVAAGNYLWSRITITFGDESTKVLYNRSVVPTVTLTEDQVTHLVTLAVGGSAFTTKLVSETKLTELAAQVEETYAKKNGYYESMTVGRAENLVDTKGDGTPQTFVRRTSAGDESIEDDGTANIKAIKGNTIVWNQLYQNGNFADGTNYWSAYQNHGTITVENGELIYTVTTVKDNVYDNKIHQIGASANLKLGHSYLALMDIYVPKVCKISAHFIKSGSYKRVDAQIGWNHYAQIYTIPDDAVLSTLHLGPERLETNGYVVGDVIKYKNLQYFDLTLMFGAGNEPSTVEEFEAMFPLDYYAYNAGELLSFNGTAIKTVGFNQFNLTTGKANLLGGHQYQITGTYTALDIDGTAVTTDASGLFTPSVDGVLTVTGGDSTTCVHLTWSGYRNGEYEEYWQQENEIPISSIIYGGRQLFLNGLCRITNSIYDEITNNKAIKRVGVVDLGSLNYTKYHTSRFTATMPSDSKSGTNIRSKIAIYDRNTGAYTETVNKSHIVSNKVLHIYDTSYTDAATFKAAMSGVYLYYELETSIEVVFGEPLNLNYKVADFGTEEMVPQGVDEQGVPLSAPFVADIIYSTDFTRELVNLPKNYQSQDSMDAMLTAMGSALGFTWSKTFDTTNNKWNYVVTPNTPES